MQRQARLWFPCLCGLCILGGSPRHCIALARFYEAGAPPPKQGVLELGWLQGFHFSPHHHQTEVIIAYRGVVCTTLIGGLGGLEDNLGLLKAMFWGESGETRNPRPKKWNKNKVALL